MSLSGTNSYMGEDPNTKIFNSPLANAPPDAETEELDIDFGDDFPDIILTEMDKPRPTEISNTVLPITADSPIDLERIENCIENTHVFDANKTEENQNQKIIENETEPKTNLLATEKFSKYSQMTSQKELNSFKVNEIIVKSENKNNTQAAIEVNDDLLLKSSISKFRVIKFNSLKNELKFVHENKINATLLKNDPNVFFVHENGTILMTAKQKELHGGNLALYSFSKKNISSEDLEKFKKNFNPDNIFLCTSDQLNILNSRLMKKTTETKEKKDEKHVNSKDKESRVIEKFENRVESLTTASIDLIKNSITGIFKISSRKTDLEKEEQAIQKRDQKKSREKKEILEKETNKMIIEGINREVQEKNKPKH